MINQLNNLMADYQQHADEAAQELDQHRRDIHAAAVTARDELAELTSSEAQRTALVCMIEDALEETSEEAITTAPVILAQFVAGNIQHPAAVAGDGRIVLEVFTDAAKALNADNRRHALEAVLLTATGAAPAGLYQFPADPFSSLPFATLERFAAIIAPDQYRVHTTQQRATQEAHRAACEAVERFALPVSITPTTHDPKQPEAERVAILNRNGGTPLVVSGVKLAGNGAVTHITRDEFALVQESPLWRSGVDVGSLEVVQQ